MKLRKSRYANLLKTIGRTVEVARGSTLKYVNTELVRANWEIGRHIIEFEQEGQERAEYGSDLLARLSKDLGLRYGKGFGRRNILDMRRVYMFYPIWQTVSAKLSWSHYVVLLGITDETARKFYEKQAEYEDWSKRELERQIESSLFERLALSRNKKDILRLSKSGQMASHPAEIIKDPYVLDFLKIPQSGRMTEKHFEKKIIENLQLFLLELGKGFTFVGRQYKVSLGGKHRR